MSTTRHPATYIRKSKRKDDSAAAQLAAIQALAARDRRRGQYVGLVRKHKVSAVILRPPHGKGWSVKMKFEVIARNLQGLEQAFKSRQPRYYVCPERRPPREVPSFAATFSAQRRK